MHWRERLVRPHAINLPRQAHALNFSCHKRYPFLSRERVCRWLAEAIDEARQRLRYSLWGYVFMPDHVHLVIWAQEDSYNTSQFLKRVKESSSRHAIQYLREEAPDWLPRLEVKRGGRTEHHFWQTGRGFDHNLDNSHTLCEMLDYIHLNPVRKQLVEQARDWVWSSAGWFEEQPLNSLHPDAIPWDWLESEGTMN